MSVEEEFGLAGEIAAARIALRQTGRLHLQADELRPFRLAPVVEPVGVDQPGRVVVRVEEFPDEETEADMGLESPFDILGLYRGVALPHKSLSDPRPDLDMVFLYRRPILDYWCETSEDLTRIVRHVLIHEIGHHFGFSDEDMARIEAED